MPFDHTFTLKRYHYPTHFPSSASACALTIGHFDGCHLGHQYLITRLVSKAKQNGLMAHMLLFHPIKYFQRLPCITSFHEKCHQLAAWGIHTLHFMRFNQRFAQLSEREFLQEILIKRLNVKWLLVGENFRFGKDQRGDTRSLRQLSTQFSINIEIVPCLSNEQGIISSTVVRSALNQGDLARAAGLLGREYTITGRVVTGQQMGQRIGFPTANLLIKQRRLPCSGVYTALVVLPELNTQCYGVVNIGIRPTWHAASYSVEVHLLNWNQMIYQKTVTLILKQKLREEIAFTTIEALRLQIKQDITEAQRLLSASCCAIKRESSE